MKQGLDLSHWNKIENWDKIKTDFIIHKCTESVDYIDQTYKENKNQIRKKGIQFGAYHFARGGDVMKEVKNFIINLGEIKKDDIIVLDWEIEHLNPVKWCNEWLSKVAELTRLKPYLYTNDARALKFADKINYPKWIARYGKNDGTISKEPSYEDWEIWQYTSRGKVEGIIGYVDLNVMKDGSQDINYEIYSQRDPRWKDIKLGFGETTIGSHGCFLTSLSMMVKQTPDKVNEILKKAGAFNKDLIISERAAEALGLGYDGRDYNINNMPKYSPSIKEVDMSPAPGKQQHFVLRVIEGKQVYTIDPWDGKKKGRNAYQFVSYRRFIKL